jgi:hypothetical protein
LSNKHFHIHETRSNSPNLLFIKYIGVKVDRSKSYNIRSSCFRSTAGINLKIQHGLNHIMTGYEISFNLESNFKINIHPHQYSTSYIWRSIQKENILFKIEYEYCFLIK